MCKMVWKCAVGLMLLTHGSQAGALDDYLAKPPCLAKAPWSEDRAPERVIPRYLQRMHDGPEPIDRAAAIGDLTLTAREMAEVPPARAAAVELLEKHILPNLEMTRQAPETSFCSWRRTVIGCKNAYLRLGMREAADRCLTLLEQGSPREDDRHMVIYQRAYQFANDRHYPEAIALLNQLPADSPWCAQREKLIKLWTHNQQQTKQKPRQNTSQKKTEKIKRTQPKAAHKTNKPQQHQ